MLLSIPLPPEIGKGEANSFFARVCELGFEAISIHCSPEAEYLDPDWLRKMKASYGLEIALHTPTKNFDLSAPLEDVRRLSVSYAIRMVKTGEAADALYYELHLGGNLTYSVEKSFAVDNAVRSLRELLTLKPSAILTVENDDRGYVFSDHEILAEVLDSYPEVMLTLDIAHAYRSGDRPSNFMRRFSRKVYAVHLHDIVDGKDHYQLGLGSIEWASLLKPIMGMDPTVAVLETYHGEYDLIGNAYRSVDFLRRYISTL
ncbi:MAG: sugar phosphate isomerase/epimerase [Nitrososphaerota archaeon]|nr:sugar phosphate isomerase/epimerase [Candidatus Bathyarchaeota archaeon]MCX8161994.1 sugar phosphate isomerase/epimerase [Candidatus Bathyarchaeota archaeon]MDW8061793.1 sugar phosphate isomerase/epimerase [Nitrososphaerota archaeon]